MLDLTCASARRSRTGRSILELGCGWGSLSLWMAERFPQQPQVLSVSNSAPQREFITRPLPASATCSTSRSSPRT